jgi:hypothetical protein
MTSEGLSASDGSKPGVTRRLSDPKSMIGATSAQVMAMIPDGWFIIPFADGRAGFQALDPGKLPGAYGMISVHKGGNPLMRQLSGADDPALFVLNSCWEMESLGGIVHGRSDAPDGHYSRDLAGETANAALLLLANKMVQVWEVDITTGDSRLLDQTAATEALRLVSNWIREEDNPNATATRTVYFLGFTVKGRKAFEKLDSKPIRLRNR